MGIGYMVHTINDMYYSVLKLTFFPGIQNFYCPAAGLLGRSRPFVHHLTTLRVWVPGGLRGACSGRSKVARSGQ